MRGSAQFFRPFARVPRGLATSLAIRSGCCRCDYPEIAEYDRAPFVVTPLALAHRANWRSPTPDKRLFFGSGSFLLRPSGLRSPMALPPKTGPDAPVIGEWITTQAQGPVRPRWPNSPDVSQKPLPGIWNGKPSEIKRFLGRRSTC